MTLAPSTRKPLARYGAMEVALAAALLHIGKNKKGQILMSPRGRFRISLDSTEGLTANGSRPAGLLGGFVPCCSPAGGRGSVWVNSSYAEVIYENKTMGDA